MLVEQRSRVLYISYAFPPAGGGGVQRSVKFTKYLPEYGWAPTVLTVANPSVPVCDDHLDAEVDPKLAVLRARTREPAYRWKRTMSVGKHRDGSQKSNDSFASAMLRSAKSWTRRLAMRFLQPDPQVLWNGPAIRMATKHLHANPHAAILATGPPFSSFLMAAQLKQTFGLPLILDFRDEWTLACRYLENQSGDATMLASQEHMMNEVLRQADVVVATTQASRDELHRRCHDVHSAATVCCIPNGFDPGDFESLPSATPTKNEFRLVYTGTLWRLTNIQPLADALSRLSHAERSNRSKMQTEFELHLAGRCTAEQTRSIDQIQASGWKVMRHEYLTHDQSIRLGCSADALLLLLADEAGAERVVPAKLFEYLAMRRPILAVCPPGEAADLVQRHADGTVVKPADIEAIASAIEQWVSRRAMPVCRREAPLQFSRPVQAKRLAALLNEITAGATKRVA